MTFHIPPRVQIARAVAAAVCAVPIVLAGSAAGDLIIDDFSDVADPDPWPVTLTTVGSTQINESGLTGVIGGNRQSTIFADALEEPGLDDVTVTVAATLGKLDYASSVGAEGSLGLSYMADLRGISSGFDLSAETQFEIEFLLFDHSGSTDVPVTIRLYDAQEDSIDLTRSLTAPGPQTLIFELDQFSRGGDVDLSNIISIDVFFDGALATDFRVEEIRTRIVVPGPAGVALLGPVVLAGRRRRRRE